MNKYLEVKFKQNDIYMYFSVLSEDGIDNIEEIYYSSRYDRSFNEALDCYLLGVGIHIKFLGSKEGVDISFVETEKILDTNGYFDPKHTVFISDLPREVDWETYKKYHYESANVLQTLNAHYWQQFPRSTVWDVAICLEEILKSFGPKSVGHDWP